MDRQEDRYQDATEVRSNYAENCPDVRSNNNSVDFIIFDGTPVCLDEIHTSKSLSKIIIVMRILWTQHHHYCEG